MTDETLRQTNELWHRNHQKRLNALEDQLWADPRFKAAFGGSYPVAGGTGAEEWVWHVEQPEAVMLCPRRHRIIPVQMFVDHNWHLSVAPVEEEATSNAPVATSARWSVRPDGPRASRVCSIPGCPKFVSGLYCDEHAVGRATAENETMDMRPRITCPQSGCNYSGVHHQEQLILMLADAIIKGRKRFRLPT